MFRAFPTLIAALFCVLGVGAQASTFAFPTLATTFSDPPEPDRTGYFESAGDAMSQTFINACDGSVRHCDGSVRICDGSVRSCDSSVRNVDLVFALAENSLFASLGFGITLNGVSIGRFVLDAASPVDAPLHFAFSGFAVAGRGIDNQEYSLVLGVIGPVARDTGQVAFRFGGSVTLHDPAEVPVPASLPLLAATLLTLFTLRRRPVRRG